MIINEICTNRSCAWKRACVRHKLRGLYLVPEVLENKLGGKSVTRNCVTYKAGKEEDEASWVAPEPADAGIAHRCCS
jgi:hypothetical protein